MTTTAIRKEKTTATLGPAFSRTVDEFAKAVSCPRCECEVYAVGISVEYFVGSVFMALADTAKGGPRKDYTRAAMVQLERKEKIALTNNGKLNQLLQYFYDNGGPVIEHPVDEQRVAKITPRYNALVNGFLHGMEPLVSAACAGEIAVAHLEARINSCILEMYAAMKALYREYEVRNAFDDLNRMRMED